MTHLRRPVLAFFAAVLVLCLTGMFSVTVRAADPLRVVLLVDSSANMATMLTEFRAGLRSFIQNIPDDVEVALISTGGQLRVRLAPTSDKVRMQEAASKFASDGGANSLLHCSKATNDSSSRQATVAPYSSCSRPISRCWANRPSMRTTRS